MDRTAIHYLPIATTLISTFFCVVLARRYRMKGGKHLLWWAVGMATYGLGTLLESSVTLFGNSVALTKAWYIAGALLGGYPLAQGSVYLHLKKRTADRLTAITLPLIVAASVCVILSPAVLENLQPHRPSGSVLGWQWVRLQRLAFRAHAEFGSRKPGPRQYVDCSRSDPARNRWRHGEGGSRGGSVPR
jgi:hypothetical protein